jgi:Cytochrome b(C-terminal)/b6/petD
LMGIIIPTILVLLLIGLPYIDRNPYRSLFKRPVAVGIGLLFVTALIALSYVGLPIYGIETPAATRIIQDIAPEEGVGPLREVPFDQLVPGVYTVSENPPDELCPNMDYGCPALTAVFQDYNNRIIEAATNESLPSELRLPNPEAVMVIEDWQQNLRKVTMRIAWQDPDTGETKSYEKPVFIHRDHLGE